MIKGKLPKGIEPFTNVKNWWNIQICSGEEVLTFLRLPALTKKEAIAKAKRMVKVIAWK